MENVDQQNVEQDTSVVALRVQLGELLSRERLTQQKDVIDVARRLMLSKLQLLAIESGESASFHHERRYLQGIKSYVFYLGLQSRADVTELVTQIEGWSAESMRASPAAGVAQLHRSAAAPTAAKTYASRGPRYVYYGVGLLVLGAITLAISEGWPFKEDEQVIASAELIPGATTSSVALPLSSPRVAPAASIVAPSTEPKPAATSAQTVQTPMDVNPPSTKQNASATTNTPAVKQDGPAMMRIDFNAECWVSLQTAEGKKVDRIYKPGESLSVPLASVSALVLGNAPAAKVFLADRPVDLMAKGLTYGNVTRLDQKGIQLLQKN
jgi:cytoskeletal protein RodZ